MYSCHQANIESRFRYIKYALNPLNAELNPICHLLALLGGATIVVVSRLRVNGIHYVYNIDILLFYYMNIWINIVSIMDPIKFIFYISEP